MGKYIILSIIIVFFSNCNNVQTGTIPIAEEAFLATLQGNYMLTDNGVNSANTDFFTVPPDPAYTQDDLFLINNFGNFSIINAGNNNITINFMKVLNSDTNSGVFKIVRPIERNNQYLKIRFDEQTNLYFSDFASSESSAESLPVSTDAFALPTPV